MPKSKCECESIIEERKNEILKHSLSLFATHSYMAVSIDDIAKSIGCSRGLIYHYFNDKENLFDQLMMRVRDYMFSLTTSIDYEVSPSDSIHQLIKRLLDEIKSSDDKNLNASCIYLVLSLYLQRGWLPKPPDIPEERPIEKQPLFMIINHLIEEGQKNKEFYLGNSKEYTVILLSVIRSVAMNKIYLKNKATIPNPDIIMRIIKKGENDAEEN